MSMTRRAICACPYEKGHEVLVTMMLIRDIQATRAVSLKNISGRWRAKSRRGSLEGGRCLLTTTSRSSSYTNAAGTALHSSLFQLNLSRVYH